MIEGHRPGVIDHSTFGGIVGAEIVVASQPGYRSRVHDTATAIGLHNRDGNTQA